MVKTININEYPLEQLVKMVSEGETVTCELKDGDKMNQLVNLYSKHEEENGVDEEEISFWHHKNIAKNLITFRAYE